MTETICTPTYVACNYGEQVYDEFNLIACGHALRACDEPAPTLCGQCGNGIREGGEECDGQDWVLTACEDVAIYSGGTLQCHPSGSPEECRLDFAMCEAPGADETASDPSAGPGGEAGGGPGGGDAETGTGSGASDDVGSGCECRSASGDSDRTPWVLGPLVLLVLTRRRGTGAPRAKALAIVALGAAAGCGDDRPNQGGDTVSDGTASTDDAGASASTAASLDSGSGSGEPADIGPWVGRYHFEDPFHPFGERNEIIGSDILANLEIHADSTATMSYEECDFETRYINYVVEPQGASSIRFLPGEGETSLRFVAAVDLVAVEASFEDACGGLLFLVDQGNDMSFASRWRPGAACWVDRCELQPRFFHIDYCEGEQPPPCP